jgi:hypothetical protein
VIDDTTTAATAKSAALALKFAALPDNVQLQVPAVRSDRAHKFDNLPIDSSDTNSDSEQHDTVITADSSKYVGSGVVHDDAGSVQSFQEDDENDQQQSQVHIHFIYCTYMYIMCCIQYATNQTRDMRYKLYCTGLTAWMHVYSIILAYAHGSNSCYICLSICVALCAVLKLHVLHYSTLP